MDSPKYQVSLNNVLEEQEFMEYSGQQTYQKLRNQLKNKKFINMEQLDSKNNMIKSSKLSLNNYDHLRDGKYRLKSGTYANTIDDNQALYTKLKNHDKNSEQQIYDHNVTKSKFHNLFPNTYSDLINQQVSILPFQNQNEQQLFLQIDQVNINDIQIYQLIDKQKNLFKFLDEEVQILFSH
ncbi:hypothetical protein PPERSA_05156 [Pseudocohnilembus persalinus]|uniref:Uncharacterized protein n=1 Tax=Pseudocohnilembus persalinus TaxID=266149 RepID=A0A0V0R976_PSEPJ|nr:hypothetical protein PPERSA_05156 [Pseudocohnilembus persalinus]|eukprot:KRX11047.1 hypothetical protein PPERSA_05156 [Pseudocohnilembus persalinus]